jgi:hypothetical protein
MKKTALLILAILILVVVGLPRTARAGSATIPADTQAAWDTMKKLAGEWEGETTSEPQPMKASVIFRVTSAGHTVMEQLMPGTEHEMVTMYYLDGPDLVMTHYCAAGNQPHLALDHEVSKPDDVTFKFVSGTNMDPKVDGHIHGVHFKLVDANTLQAEWTGFKDGKLDHTLAAKFVRKK